VEIEARLMAIEGLADSLAKLEESSRPDDVTAIRDLQHAIKSFRTKIDPMSPEQQVIYLDILETNLFDGFDLALRNLRTALTAEEIDLEGLPADIRSQWIGGDGRHRVAIYPSEDMANRDSEKQFVDGVRNEEPDATGIPAMEVEAAKLVVSSFQQALATALAVVCVLLILLLRNWRDPILVLIPVLLAALLTVGVMVSSGMLLNFANIIALPLLFGIGVDNGIHIVHRYRVHRYRVHRYQAGVSGNENLMATSTARAVFFGTLTTVVSFGSLALSAHYGMATMGKLLTIGMIMTLITTLIVLPTLLPDANTVETET
jgi:predicted RND superfamily exporter protein